MQHPNSLMFNGINILQDDTAGLIEVSTAERIGDNRKFRILNNFNGRFSCTNANDLVTIVDILNSKIDQKISDEIVVGFIEGSVILAFELARQRGVRYTCSTAAKVVGYKEKLRFSESHKVDSEFILYGLKKGDRVMLIEDEISTGDSFVEVINMLQSSGVEILNICTVFEVVNFNAREKLKNQFGLDLVSLIQLELIE